MIGSRKPLDNLDPKKPIDADTIENTQEQEEQEAVGFTPDVNVEGAVNSLRDPNIINESSSHNEERQPEFTLEDLRQNYLRIILADLQKHGHFDNEPEINESIIVNENEKSVSDTFDAIKREQLVRDNINKLHAERRDEFKAVLDKFEYLSKSNYPDAFERAQAEMYDQFKKIHASYRYLSPDRSLVYRLLPNAMLLPDIAKDSSLQKRLIELQKETCHRQWLMTATAKLGSPRLRLYSGARAEVKDQEIKEVKEDEERLTKTL